MVWPRWRISRIRVWPRFFNFAVVGGGKRCNAGDEGADGTSKVGERKDSTQATRGRLTGARVFIRDNNEYC